MADDNTPTVTSRRRKPTSHMRLRLETSKRLQKLSQKRKAKGIEGGDVTSIPRVKGPVENTLRHPPVPTSRFRKRQAQKTWLPTHIWHAKRAHMVVRWRYAIAESPTEKCYRPTHRASTLRGAIAWDQSYHGTIFIQGKERDVVAILQKFLSTADAETVTHKGPVRRGKRSWQGWIYEADECPTKPIAPVNILWCVPNPKMAIPEEDASCPGAKGNKKNPRQVFLRVHPAAFYQLWTSLLSVSKSFCSVTVEDLRFEIGSIEVAGPDATDALLSVLQPRIEDTTAESPEGVWNGLQGLTNPSSLPPGSVLGLNIMDPRLRFPPVVRHPPQGQEDETTNKLFSILSTWPVDKTQGAPDLFSREARVASTRVQSSQKRINKRKSETTPGELPASLSTDPRIPIILMANRHPAPLNTNGKGFSAATSNAVGSWTILLPWKWVLPVWYSIMHCPKMRFGGINQIKQVKYENAVGAFPDDFPGTRAGMDEEARKAAERKAWWEKRPKQKRVSWEKVDLGEGRKGELGRGEWCDWMYLIRQISESGEAKAKRPVEVEPTLARSDTVPISSSDLQSSEVSNGSWGIDSSLAFLPSYAQVPTPLPIISTADTPTTIITLPSQVPKSPFHPAAFPWTVPASSILPMLSQPHKPLQHPISTLRQESLSKAVFSANITYLHRGCPGDRARVYRIPSKVSAATDPTTRKLREGWLGLLASHESQSRKIKKSSQNSRQVHSQAPQEPLQPGSEGYPAVPSEEDLIGFVTSGNYNLKEGKGVGVGSLSFVRALGRDEGIPEDLSKEGLAGIVRKGKRKARSDGVDQLEERRGPVSRICVVREVGNSVGRLARWDLI